MSSNVHWLLRESAYGAMFRRSFCSIAYRAENGIKCALLLKGSAYGAMLRRSFRSIAYGAIIMASMHRAIERKRLRRNAP